MNHGARRLNSCQSWNHSPGSREKNTQQKKQFWLAGQVYQNKQSTDLSQWEHLFTLPQLNWVRKTTQTALPYESLSNLPIFRDFFCCRFRSCEKLQIFKNRKIKYQLWKAITSSKINLFWPLFFDIFIKGRPSSLILA